MVVSMAVIIIPNVIIQKNIKMMEGIKIAFIIIKGSYSLATALGGKINF
jgi:hypothetical protein